MAQTINNLSVTWNSGGTTFDALKFNVTDTASAAASTLQNFQVGGTTKYKVTKDGSVVTEGGLVVPKTSGYGIKVDTATPTFGWRDLTSDITLRGTGSNDPTFTIYTGTALRAYQFSGSTMNEVFMVFHVPHDYAPGTDVYFHAHWSNAAASPGAGAVYWGFEYAFAKGFDQAAFPATTTVGVTQTASATRYRHMVAETAAVTIAGLEVDGLILVRAFRDPGNVGDTLADAVFLHTVDIHYQSTNLATKGKAPNFYA